MSRLLTAWALLLASGMMRNAGAAQTESSNEAAKKIERTACVPCHSLRIVQSQRLSPAAWTKEVDKMIGWGALIPERQALIDYLAAEYSNSKPLPTPALSQSGVARTQP
jgi:mono/diheme cytochrome c family protein